MNAETLILVVKQLNILYGELGYFAMDNYRYGKCVTFNSGMDTSFFEGAAVSVEIR
jgi:hypothetical protein